jgi:hypothetical protein
MMHRMQAKLGLLTSAILFWFLPVSFSAESAERGTLRALNEHPLETPLLSWHLQDTRLASRHRWKWTANFAYSNIYKSDAIGNSQVIIDNEPLRSDLAVTYGFATKWDAELQISAFRYSGGFMDEFIRSFEGSFGFPTRGQQSGVNNQFRFLLIRDRQVIIDRTSSLYGLGDTRILVRRFLGARGGWSVCTIGAIKLPTGKKGLGSGGPDAGFGIAAKYVRGRWGLRSELDALFTSELFGIPTRSRADFKFGIEYARTKVSFLMQTDMRGHAIAWGKNTLDDPPRQICFGVKFSGPIGVAHQIYMTEDLSRVSPDITFGYALEWGR